MSWNMAVALALVAAGAWAAWLRIEKRKAARQRAGWDRADGRVLSHEIVETSSTDSHGDTTDHFEPRLTYEYRAQGAIRTGSRASAEGLSFASRKKAQAWLDARPIGGTVEVRVDPADPASALLDTSYKADWWVPALFVALGIAVALGLFG